MMTEINFRNIRKHGTSQEDGFEELCCQLFSLMPPHKDAKWFRKRGAGGDAGVEAYWTLPNGDEHALQAKYFFELEQPQREQITKAVTAMVNKHPACKRYIICLPFNLGEQRQGKKWSQKRHWDKLVSNWKKLEPSRDIEFELWDETKIGSFLADDKPELNGRRNYWFDDKVLSQRWFEDRFAEALRNLGQRYTPEMHVDVSLAKKFSAFRQDKSFKRHLADLPDLPRFDGKSDAAKNLADEILDTLSKASLLIQDASAMPISSEFEGAERLISEALNKARKGEQTLAGDDKNRNSYFNFLDEIDAFRRHLDECDVESATVPSVLLLGEAGAGKSHVLADAVQVAQATGEPAILLLGQQLHTGSPWDFILSALSLNGNAEDFLGALDASAQAHGCKALLAIDALNEGNGKRIWPDELPGFVERIKRFPNIVLVLSCRSSYQRRITRNLHANQIYELWHYGFRGHEEAAAAVYMDRNGISRPDTPLLDPEFSNPLFLKTICETLKRRNETSFPKGLRGVTKIFNFYVDSVADAIEFRLDLDPGQKLVQCAVDALVAEFLATGEDYILHERAHAVTEKFLSSQGSQERNLLFQLKSEGVLSDDLIYRDKDDDAGVEVIRVSYERFLDHFRAKAFIEGSVDPNDPASAFSMEGPFRQLLGGDIYQKAGIIEALSIQIPERFGAELYGLVELDENDNSSNQLHRYLKESFKESLYWRDPRKTNDDTLVHLNKLLRGKGPQSFEVLMRCATSPEHLLNARLLHRNLLPMQLADRDAVWSTWITENFFGPGDESSSTLWALIDWAWSVDRTRLTDDQVYLSCIALGWLLASPRRSLRDRATKAMVAILGSRTEIARRLVLDFDKVDDFYVIDRIYAVAYAVALAANPAGLKALARTIVNRNLRSNKDRKHLLIGEYAKGIAQHAEKHNVLPRYFNVKDADFNATAATPLINFSPKEIEEMRDDVGPSYWSVMSGDFGTYTMRDVFNFSPTPLAEETPATCEQQTLEFIARVVERNSKAQQLFERYADAVKSESIESEKRFKKRDNQFNIIVVSPDGSERAHDPSSVSDDYDEEAHQRAKQALEDANTALVASFNENEEETWRWLNAGRGGDKLAKYSRRAAKRWIIKRVSELGWTKERFEGFERYGASSSGRMDHDAERMGKKYQWIAYHELLARIASRYYYLCGFDEEPSVLSGAWQLSRRDIDPTLLVRGKSSNVPPEQAWWTSPLPNVTEDYSFDQACEWIRSYDDLPPDSDGLTRSHPKTGQTFYVLETYHTARQKRVKLDSSSRSFSRSISTAIMPLSEYAALVSSLRNRKISGIFSNPQEYSADGFIGEYPWHPSWYPIRDFFGENEIGRELPSHLHYHFPVRDYYCEDSGYDHSIENSVRITLPSGHLIDELELEFDRYDPSIWSRRGEVIFLDPARETSHQASGLIDLQVFSDWLQSNNYAAVSAATSFKQFYQPRDMRNFAGELMDCQLSCFDGRVFKGERWTVLTEFGPTDKIVRKPTPLNFQLL